MTRMALSGVCLVAFLFSASMAQDNAQDQSEHKFSLNRFLQSRRIRSPKLLQVKTPLEPERANKASYRLPAVVSPFQYDLKITPDIYSSDPSAFSFRGSVTIFIKVLKATTSITLHSLNLDENTIRESAQLQRPDGTDTGYVHRVTFDKTRHFLTVTLSQQLRKNQKFRLYFEFSAPLTESGEGLFYTSYETAGGSTVYLAATKFEATYARSAFPCFDEPALKAKFNVRVVRQKTFNGRHYKSWSNSDLLRTESLENGFYEDIYKPTPPTSPFLMGFVVADFKCLTSTTKHNVKYSTCAQPEVFRQGQTIHDWGVKELEWLQDQFKSRFAINKLDNLAVPNLPIGGMESWGLSIFDEDILLEAGVSTPEDKSWALEITAHHLSHMWFGSLVTIPWWNSAWQSEAVNFLLSNTAVDSLLPNWRMMDQYVVRFIHAVMEEDSLTSSHPLAVEVEDPLEIEDADDAIASSKGTAIIRMLSSIMGRHFTGGLNAYLDKHKFEVADHTDLFSALNGYLRTKGQKPMPNDFMDPWVTQSHYPLVTVDWSRRGKVELTQQCFLPAGQGSACRSKWDIPITMKSSAARDDDEKVTWFQKSKTSLTISNNKIPAPPTQGNENWILLNIKQGGYYRVNYPEANWLALIQQLKTDPKVIHPINRAQIINDAWSLAKAGKLGMNIAIKTLQVLKNDDDYVSWRAMRRELSYLDQMLIGKDIYGKFQEYMKTLVQSSYGKIRMTSNPREPAIKMLQRRIIASYACKYGVANCKADAKRLFRTWKSDPQKIVQKGMREVILCNGVRFGKNADWEFVYRRYKNSASEYEKSDLLSALSCTKEPSLLKKLLMLTVQSGGIQAEDVSYVLDALPKHAVDRNIGFSFLKQNYDRLSKRLNTYMLAHAVGRLTIHLNTPEELTQLRQFMSNNNVSGVQQAFKKAVDQTSVNIKWMKNYYPMTEQFLEDTSNW